MEHQRPPAEIGVPQDADDTMMKDDGYRAPDDDARNGILQSKPLSQ